MIALWKKLKGNSFSTPLLLFYVAVLIFFFTRVFLLVEVLFQSSDLTYLQILYSFAVGFLYDVCVAAIIVLPFVIQVATTMEKSYKNPYYKIIIGAFIVILFILFFTSLVPIDYSPPLYHAVEIYFVLRLAIFLALLRVNKKIRIIWRRYVLYTGFFLFTFLLLVNALAEYCFWAEFGSRYNFIAVDYLIYTNEVLGNIYQSYHILLFLLLAALLSLSVVMFFSKRISLAVKANTSMRSKFAMAFGLLLAAIISYKILSPRWMDKSDNTYANQLAGNGVYTFANAFFSNELSFYEYYQTLDNKEAFSTLRKILKTPNTTFNLKDSFSVEKNITYSQPPIKNNVVLITVESLSAGFMKSFGNTQNITPVLDSLADRSIFFTNLYASGTRTVRGLEAVTLSIPPTPGESIIKRPNNSNLFTLGAVLKDNNYAVQFIYGGYSYFDNMYEFFSHNGYAVYDRTSLKKSEIHYANIWGVADEDLFSLSLHLINNNYKKKKPFFTHIMTVSNHRPYTYPDGRIDIPSSSQTREGAVKYTDYAIGKFIKEASRQPWFNNTIFIIVADHCASSAGSVSLPVTGYHIPMLMYAPSLIVPQKINTLTAQIDIAPTILGLLKISYRSKFFGKDIFAAGAEQRAFISTYEGLGFIKNNQLIIQSPVKQVAAYLPDFKTGESQKIPMNDSLKKEAISYYQCASWLLKSNGYSYK